MQRQAIGAVRTVGRAFRLRSAASMPGFERASDEQQAARSTIASKPRTSSSFLRRAVTLPTKGRGMPGCLHAILGWAVCLFGSTLLALIMRPGVGRAQATVTVSVAPTCGPSGDARAGHVSTRTIDGFGTTAPAKQSGDKWVHDLYYGDLGASLLRLDLTPRFRAPVADHAYNSPWFHGAPALPGPEGNNVRTYRDVGDYTREYAGRRAQVVVMGPDIEKNVRQFDFSSRELSAIGGLAREGARRNKQGFRLLGSLWSPAPWLKRSSGETFSGAGDVMPKSGTPWPFIWAGNFSGGVLDTTDEPRAAFDDGTGPTSALTQFARSTAAYVLGFQRAFQVRLSALSLQNELNFETFYNSCSYPAAAGYIAALKALRRELDAHAELRDVALMGPEDLMGGDAYALWQFGSAPGVSKNLQYLAAIARDPEAARALSFFAVHAYATDGVHSAGNDEQQWRWWVDGWRAAPAAGLPAEVLGARAYGKKSWMTEMSGEPNVWLPAAGAALGDSALGLALKVHRALTTGAQSAWLYWQLSDGKDAGAETLTDDKLRARSPKYVAFKHYARFIQPGACVSEVVVAGGRELHASAYRRLSAQLETSTVVMINTSDQAQQVALRGVVRDKRAVIDVYTSTASALWQQRRLPTRVDALQVELPAHSVLTLVATAPQRPRPLSPARSNTVRP